MPNKKLSVLDAVTAGLDDDYLYLITVNPGAPPAYLSKKIKKSDVLKAHVAGPASATTDRIATYDGATGKLIKDSGYTVATLLAAAGDVDGPASAIDGRIALFDGTSGKLIKDGGTLLSSLVVGPASVTDGRVAAFDGTTGKLLKQDTRLAADLVAGPSSVTNLAFAQFDGTSGKLLKATGTQVDLTTQVTGDLPLSNLAQASGASKLLGRGSASGAGDFQELTAGTGLSFSGTVLSATPGTGVANVNPSLCGFRLTLVAGQPVHNTPAVQIPTSTDQSGETVTCALDLYATGSICTVSATIGGLTTGTIYYLNRASAGVYSFHTTLANALAGTSKVNLTANITSELWVSGVTNTTLYFSPHSHNLISLYSGSAWAEFSSSEISVALGTLTADKNYDVFAYDSSGLTLELVAWTSDNVRATDIVRQDGAWVKSGSLTKKYVGTIRTDTTTTTINDGGGIKSQTGGKRYVWNMYNRVRSDAAVFDGNTTWTISSATIRQANNNAGNKCEFVVGIPDDVVEAIVQFRSNSTTTALGWGGIGFNSTTSVSARTVFRSVFSASVNVNPTSACSVTNSATPKPGYNYVAWLEWGENANTVTFNGSSGVGTPSTGGGAGTVAGLRATLWV